MNQLTIAVRDGAVKGVRTTLMLCKIVLPIYAVVVIFRYSPIMQILQETFAPAMKIFHLPGDAIMPLVTGLFTDEYATIAVMSAFDFHMAQITTIAMIVLVAHSMPVEAAIAKKIGLSPVKFSLFRLVFAVVTGIVVGFLGGLLS